jgi:hypothetical protein
MLQQIAPTGALEKIATPSSIGYSNNVEVFQTAAAGADAALEKMSREPLIRS